MTSLNNLKELAKNLSWKCREGFKIDLKNKIHKIVALKDSVSVNFVRKFQDLTRV